jgi:O-antigen ligase
MAVNRHLLNRPLKLRERAALRSRSIDWKALLLLIGSMLFAVIAGLSVVVASWIPLALLFILTIVAYGVYDYRFGVGALMIFYPVSAMSLLPSFSGLNVQNMLFLLTLFGLSMRGLFAGEVVRQKLVDKPLLLLYLLPFFLAAFFGSGHAAALGTGLREAEVRVNSRGGFLLYYVLKPGLFVAFASMVAIAVRNSKKPLRYLTLMAIGATLISLLMWGYFILMGAPLGELVSARSFFSPLGMHSNQLAVFVNTALAMLLFSGIATPSRSRKIIFLMLSAFLVATSLLTFSRGGYIGLVLIIASYFYYTRDFRKLLIGLIAVIGLYFLIPDAVIDRVTIGYTHGSSMDVTSGRLDYIWLPLLGAFFEKPIFGHGLMFAGWSGLVPVRQAHNAYIDLLVDVGIIGLLCVVSFFLYLHREFRRQSYADEDPTLRGFFRGAAVGVMVMMQQAFTDDRLFPNNPQMLIWMAYGILLGRSAKWLATTHVNLRTPINVRKAGAASARPVA